MNKKCILFILTILPLIIRSETNNTFNSTKDVKNKTDFDLSEEEMDKILFCSKVWLTKTQNEASKIQKLIKELNITNTDILSFKIGIDIIKSCLGKVQIEEARQYFYNLTYYNEIEPNNVYLLNTKIDFDGYRKNPNFTLSDEEKNLSVKLKKTLNLFEKNRDEIYKRSSNRTKIDEEQRKVKIGKFDINKIPKFFNIVLFLVVFGLFFGGVIFLVKNMNKKKETKKKKKDKLK